MSQATTAARLQEAQLQLARRQLAAKLRRKRQRQRMKPRKPQVTRMRATTASAPVAVQRPMLSRASTTTDDEADEPLTADEAALLATAPATTGPSPFLIVGGLAVGALVLYLVYRAGKAK